MSLLKINKKEETKPSLPNLYFYDIDLEAEEWNLMFNIPIKDYIKDDDLCNLYEEDLKEIKRWREENPDWEIDVARREIRKK